MEPAAEQVGVGDQAGDPGQGLEELHEHLGVELAEHRSDRVGDRLLVAQGVLELVGVVEVLPGGARLGNESISVRRVASGSRSSMTM